MAGGACRACAFELSVDMALFTADESMLSEERKESVNCARTARRKLNIEGVIETDAINRVVWIEIQRDQRH